jgi:hypothetical protein
LAAAKATVAGENVGKSKFGITDQAKINTAQGVITGFGEGLNKDSIKNYLDSEDTQLALRRMSGFKKGDPRMNAEVQNLQKSAMLMDGEEKRTALGLINQIKAGIDKNGVPGSEFWNALGGDEKSKEMREAFTKQGNAFSSMASEIAFRTPTGSVLGPEYAAINDAYGKFDAAGVQANQDKLINRLAAADQNTDAYKSEMNAIANSGEGGAGLARSVGETRKFERDISGKGRRGRAGANDLAVNTVTGGMFGQMDITGAGGRRYNANQLIGLMGGKDKRYDKERAAAQASLVQGLADAGVADADKIGTDFAAMARSGVGSTESKAMLKRLQGNESLQRASAAATERMQAQRDPIGAKQLTVLEAIRDRLPSGPPVPPPGGNADQNVTPAVERSPWGFGAKR